MAIRYNASGESHSRTTNLPAVSAATLMGWFKITTDRNAFSTFLTLEDAGSFGNLLQTATDGTTLIIYSAESSTSGSSLTVGTWYNLALTIGGGTCLAYVNGVLDITRNAVTASPTTMRVGNDNIDEWLNGVAAAVKIYHAALSAAEIANEMRCYVPPRTANLNTWLPMVGTVLSTNA